MSLQVGARNFRPDIHAHMSQTITHVGMLSGPQKVRDAQIIPCRCESKAEQPGGGRLLPKVPPVAQVAEWLVGDLFLLSLLLLLYESCLVWACKVFREVRVCR